MESKALCQCMFPDVFMCGLGFQNRLCTVSLWCVRMLICSVARHFMSQSRGASIQYLMPHPPISGAYMQHIQRVNRPEGASPRG